MRRILKDTVRLVTITLIAGVLLSAVYALTKEPIEKAQLEELQSSYRSVFSQAAGFEEISLSAPVELDGYSSTLNSALYALDGENNIIGGVYSVTSHEGYGGDITVSMGVDSLGRITGVLVTSMNETVSLGANCQDEEWLSQFVGISFETGAHSGAQSDGGIDAISGATYTTEAVLDAVNAGLGVAVDDRPLHRRAAPVFGQQGDVEVDAAELRDVQHRLGQDAAVGHHHDQIGGQGL